ncbi:MAG: hypothetical protein Q9M20_02935 [Mariprofundaceae bacterium]|nr:hypothetical protein [Mariprofundaceae bacterium]
MPTHLEFERAYILLLGVYIELMARSTYSENELYLITSDLKVKHLKSFERSFTNGGTGGSNTDVSFVYNTTGKYFAVTESGHFFTDKVDEDGKRIVNYPHKTYYLEYNEEQKEVIEVSSPF